MRSSIKEVQTHLTELFSDAVVKIQAEAEKRAEAMIQRVMQALKQVPRLITARPAAVEENDTANMEQGSTGCGSIRR